MEWYRNSDISAKLTIGFLFVTVITGFIGIVGQFE